MDEELVSTDTSSLSYISALTLLECLRNKNIDLKHYAKDFDEHYHLEDGIREIVFTLFNSAGITSFTYEAYQNLDDKEISRLAALKDSLHEEPDILLDSFQRNLFKFLEGYFNLNQELFCSNDFGRRLCKIAVEFMNGKWDSFRIMAATLGIKIISAVITGLETKSIASKHYDELGQTWIMLHKSVVGQGMRDCCAYVVQVILDEFLHLSYSNAAILRKPDIFKWICFGLGLKSPQNRKTSYEILLQIFIRTKDSPSLLRLFQKVRIQLTRILHNESNAEKTLAMKILCHMAKKEIDLDLTEEEKHSVYLAIFNPSRQVGSLAAKFLTFTLFKNVSSEELTNLNFLEAVINFAEKSPIKDFPLLADSFSYIFIQNICWDEWAHLMGSSNSSTAAELFYAVVERLVTNKVPRNANAGYNSVSKISSLKFSDLFTKSFNTWWFAVIKFKNIRRKLPSLLKMIEIVKFLKEEANPELWFEIGSVLLEIFFESVDDSVIQKSMMMVMYVADMLQSSPGEDLFLSRLNVKVGVIVGYLKDILSFKPCLFESHGEIMSSQIVAACRYIPISDNDKFWTLAIQEVLKNGIDCRRSSELVLLLMNILFGRYFCMLNKIFKMIEKRNASDDPEYVVAINMDVENMKMDSALKVDFLERYFKPLLEDQTPIRIRGVACEYFMKMIILSGVHMHYHDEFIAYYSVFNEEIFKNLPTTVSPAMAFKCKGNDACCNIVRIYCKMVYEGILPIERLTPLLEHIGLNDFHHEIVVDAMNNFLKKFGMDKCAHIAKIIHLVLSNAVDTKSDPKSFCENLIDILFVNHKLKLDVLVFIHKVSLISQNRCVNGFLVKSINLLKAADKAELYKLTKRAFKDLNFSQGADEYVDALNLISEPFDSTTVDRSQLE